MGKVLHWGLISRHRQKLYGIACIWVIMHHNFFDWPTVLAPLKKLCNYGNCGVDIFLFLSGISLYFAYMHTQKNRLCEFYTRRIIRLIVPYLLMALPYWVWRDIFLERGNFLLDITMLSFPLNGTITTWYVGAILVLYLAYPGIHYLYFNKNKLSAGLGENSVAILLTAFWAGMCAVTMHVFPELYDNIEIAMTRVVVFLVGCKVGQWVYEKRRLNIETVLLWAIFLLFIFLFFVKWYNCRTIGLECHTAGWQLQ